MLADWGWKAKSGSSGFDGADAAGTVLETTAPSHQEGVSDGACQYERVLAEEFGGPGENLLSLATRLRLLALRCTTSSTGSGPRRGFGLLIGFHYRQIHDCRYRSEEHTSELQSLRH